MKAPSQLTFRWLGLTLSYEPFHLGLGGQMRESGGKHKNLALLLLEDERGSMARNECGLWELGKSPIYSQWGNEDLYGKELNMPTIRERLERILPAAS